MNVMPIAQLIALLVPIFVVVLGISALAIVFPMMRRLGQYLDLRMEERRSGTRVPSQDQDRILESLESIESRLKRLEDRQDFTERLLEKPRDRPREGS